MREALKRLSYTLTPPTPLAPPSKSAEAIVENWPELKGRAFMTAFRRGLPEGFSALASFLEVEKGLNVILLTAKADGPLREGLAFTLPYVFHSVVDGKKSWWMRLCLLALCKNPKPWIIERVSLGRRKPPFYLRPSLLSLIGAPLLSAYSGHLVEGLVAVLSLYPFLKRVDEAAAVAYRVVGLDLGRVEAKRREEADRFSCTHLLKASEEVAE